MESGAILHLALLRKLCSGSPKCNYLHKFKHFRSVNKHNQRKKSFTINTINTSRQLFRKYPQSQRDLNYVKAKSQSLDQKACREKTSRPKVQESMNLSGWNVQNEQEFMYAKLLQKNNFSFFSEELKKVRKQAKKSSRAEKQKKFTYCEEDLNCFFKESNVVNAKAEAKLSVSRKERSKKLKPLIIDQIKTEENMPKHASIYIGKQNFLAEELVLICPSKIPKLVQKIRIPNINDFVKGFSSQLNRKRVC